MIPITLSPNANQSFTWIEDGHIYRVHIFDLDGTTMAADVNIDGEDVILGVRALHASFFLPWPSLEQKGGNFMLYDDQQAPRWEKFGQGTQLFYITAAELAAGRAGVTNAS